jgi:hypothetical protein
MDLPSRRRVGICACWRSHVCALLGYVVLALVFAWPLPLRLSTHLTGSPEGDTGVYVWNQWVFHHELLTHGSSPYYTDRIFSTTGRADLTLHNYTALANVLALPLLGSLGVVATFNLIYLCVTALSGYAMFLLARALKTGDVEAWLAGVLFAWSPMLVTRGAGHFSLVAAAPLPLFMLLLIRAHQRARLRDGAYVGLMIALAFAADVYYAVYCVLLAALYTTFHVVRLEPRSETVRSRKTSGRTLDLLILFAATIVVMIVITGGWVFTLFGRTISVRQLYTPVLVLTILITLRVARHYRARVMCIDCTVLLKAATITTVAVVVAALCLTPVLSALWVRIAEGRFVSPSIYWRSSPAGVDLLAVVLPNPNHAMAPAAWRGWLSGRFDGYLESVASIPLSAALMICIALRRGWHPPRLWVALAIAVFLLALGPFLHIGGVNTYVPGPWALVRYIPVIGLARNPARIAVLMMLVLAVLFALGLSFIRATHPRRVWLHWVIAAALVLELLPLPRPLYSARVPAIYDRVSADPEDVRVLHLPFGVRDGVSSFGNYTARTQFFQTRHGKPLIGGVLSRVSERRVNAIRRHVVLDALMRLSEGKPLAPETYDMLVEYAPQFLARANVRYVVIDHERASSALVDFAKRAFNLEVLESDEPFVLYRPGIRPTKKYAGVMR